MARKQVVFLCLVAVGVVVSLFNDCDVKVKQKITIQTCTLAPENEAKVDGSCPMEDFVVPIQVCKDVTTTICNQAIVRRGITIYPNGTHCLSIPAHIQHCVTSYEKHSFDGVASRRRGVEEGNTCVVERATCEDVEVEVPKEVECNHVF